MAVLASEMEALGVRPGLWYRPLLCHGEVDPSWILRDGETGTVLDPSLPAVLEKVEQDVSRFRRWGFELLKHDFSTYDIFGLWGYEMGWELFKEPTRFGDPSKTTAEIILAFYRTIARAMGDGEIIGCNTIGHLGAGLFSMQRTGDDTSGIVWERTRLMGINTLSHRMCQHNTFFAVDADCVGLTDAISWKKNRQWLDLLSRSGTPLFVSADPATLGEDQKAALIRAFKMASRERSPAEPLDWMHTTVPNRWLIDGEEERYRWDLRNGSDFGPRLRPNTLFI